MRRAWGMLGLGLATAVAACGSGDDGVQQCDPPRGEPMSRFVDVTAESGIDFLYATPDFKGAGLAVADFDGDGLPEVVAGRRTGGLQYWRNRGALRFEERTDAGLDAAWAATALGTADLDNDGDLDLVVASPNVARVMANRGDGTFVEAARFDESGTTEHVLPVDLDGDGLLDLYFSNYDLSSALRTLNRVFRNRGNLTFEPAGTLGGGRSWSATAFDIEGDGDQDLYVANDTLLADFGNAPPPPAPYPVDMLLRNDGFGDDGKIRFTDLAAEMKLDEPRSSMGGLLADFNDDGLLDLYVPNYGAKKLFLRDASGGFTEAAPSLGLSAIGRTNAECGPDTTNEDCLILSWSAALSDFDLDGRDELVLVNGETEFDKPPPVVMFARGPELPYYEVSPDIACLDARGLAVTDLDGDGDQDQVIGQKEGPLVVYATRGAPSPTAWLRVTLRGTASNRDGIGAIVIVQHASGRTQRKVVGHGGVIHTGFPHEAFFGIGDDPVIAVEVRWPSGRVSQLAAPTPGALVIDEP